MLTTGGEAVDADVTLTTWSFAPALKSEDFAVAKKLHPGKV